ncbi:DMT family transporter [Chitinimonas koreensis]|uniref:DMT family transporter n=1 Tax=Chitinimonas koreensis TaxID=356302 RepID=UPI00040451BB|nr:DMT family transporter [Chitinimonas koreensis]QNM97314.1 DMT family transporter [Chitinimonas koreensis]
MSESSRRLGGALLILLSAACFGIMPLFGRLAYAAGADAQAILLLRFVIAAGCLAVLMLWRRERWPRGRLALGLLAMGAIGYAGQAFSYFTALRHASASLTALLLYTFPVIVTLIAAAWLDEPLTRRKVVALLLACGGLALTVGDALSGSPVGIAFGLGAALIYSVYIAVGSRLTPRAGALPSSAVVMLGGALTFGAVSAVATPAWPQTTTGWLAVAAIGVLCSVVAALAFFAGLARVGASEAAMLSTFEPVVTVVLAAWLLGERLSASQWIGGAVIIAAVLLLAKSPSSGTPPE